MRIYAQKGYSLSEQDRLAISQFLIKAGYAAWIDKERKGNTTCYYVEFHKKEELLGQKKAAGEAGTFVDGKDKNPTQTIPQNGGSVNGGARD